MYQIYLKKVNKENLLDVLEVFKEGRNSLVLRLTSEEPELFGSLFEYEENTNLMALVMEKEYILWINEHFQIFDKFCESRENLETFTIFKELVFKLIENKIIEYSANNDISSKEFCISLLQDKREILQDFIGVASKNERNYKKLLYSYQKDKVLFDREFKRLSRG